MLEIHSEIELKPKDFMLISEYFACCKNKTHFLKSQLDQVHTENEIQIAYFRNLHIENSS